MSKQRVVLRSVLILLFPLVLACTSDRTGLPADHRDGSADMGQRGGADAQLADGPGAPDDASPGDGAAGARTCASIMADYTALTEDPARKRCSSPAECQVLSGQCAVALGGCYHALNMSVTQAQINALGQEYQKLGCLGMGSVCRCPAPPKVDCAGGTCTLK